MNKGKPKVYAVVLNWNCKDDLMECLDSLARVDYPNFAVIVVDNGSTDGSPEAMRQKFPWVELVVNERNLGFAEGNNVGIRHALNKGCDYVFLLNNDTTVDKLILKDLIDVAEEQQDIGMVGPMIYQYNQPNKIWFAGGRRCWHRGFEMMGFGETDNGQYNEIREVEYITGCGLLVKRKVIDEIGLMDPRYFNYVEETEWNFRARRKGYRVVWIPQAKMWHKGGASSQGWDSPLSLYYQSRNILLFTRENGSLWDWLILWCSFVPYLMLRAIGFLLSGQRKHGLAILCGARDFLLGRLGEGTYQVTEARSLHKSSSRRSV